MMPCWCTCSEPRQRGDHRAPDVVLPALDLHGGAHLGQPGSPVSADHVDAAIAADAWSRMTLLFIEAHLDQQLADQAPRKRSGGMEWRWVANLLARCLVDLLHLGVDARVAAMSARPKRP